jgi:hypothetical protein
MEQLEQYATEMERIVKWSRNTVWSHKQRGLRLDVSPHDIFIQAFKVLVETGGCCPECGRRFEYGTDHWISLEYIDPTTFEVICMDCNVQRAIREQRRGFTYLNSK